VVSQTRTSQLTTRSFFNELGTLWPSSPSPGPVLWFALIPVAGQNPIRTSLVCLSDRRSIESGRPSYVADSALENVL
jgi:hypothetical protein